MEYNGELKTKANWITASLFSGTALCLAAHTINKYDPN